MQNKLATLCLFDLDGIQFDLIVQIKSKNNSNENFQLVFDFFSQSNSSQLLPIWTEDEWTLFFLLNKNERIDAIFP